MQVICRTNPSGAYFITIFSFAAIEDEYVGPKLEDSKVTLKFMKELMEWFKDQKKLHRKCAYQVNLTTRV